MKVARNQLNNTGAWEAAGVVLPRFDVETMAAETMRNPVWLHVGAGNIFRGFIAVLQQRLLNEGLADRGIIAAETYDYEIIDRIYTAQDHLTMNVTLLSNATSQMEIIASVAEGLKMDAGDAEQMERFYEIATSPGLQMISFTITEKGYALRQADGQWLPLVHEDMKRGPKYARHAMSLMAAGLYRRYQAGAWPISMVSMDNCAHNGQRLSQSILEVAQAWKANGFVEEGFLSYIGDAEKVAFPWSMIDKITPRPAPEVEAMLQHKGIEGMEPIVTGKGTYIAPFVNAERPQYLVIEDAFPNGRPSLEKAGVYLTSRKTVNDTERMKVTTCLNPLHTAMSVYGCLLGYTRIYQEMNDEDIVALIRRLGYVEGLPVVTDPGILSPRDFLNEVMNERLPNPFMPDAPQRIVTDTSQKVGIRFGETIQSYVKQGRDLDSLIAIPLALAGWLRYLLGVTDAGEEMEVSADPLKDELQAALADIRWNDPKSYQGQARGILANTSIFGLDLTKTPLADTIEALFVKQLAGVGAVRRTLHEVLAKG